MMVLQLFNRERKAYKRFSDINQSHMDAFKDAIMAYSVYYPVVDLFSSIAIACVIWWGGQDIIRQASGGVHVVAVTASLGVLIAFIQYAFRFFRPIMDFSEKYNILQSAMAASERVFKLLDTPIDVVSPAVTKKPTGPGRIEFDHVWFAYREAPVEVGRNAGGSPATTPSNTVPGNGRGGAGLRPVPAE